MKQIRTFLVAFLCLISLGVYADEKYDGIFVTVSGSTICYKLDDVPSITYSADKATAYLTLRGEKSPALSVNLGTDGALQIVYGTYTIPTSTKNVETVTVTKRDGYKYITGVNLSSSRMANNIILMEL